MTAAPDPIRAFTGRHAFLANPYAVDFTHAETAWRSATHAIEAARAATAAHADWVRAAASPADARARGRAIIPRPDWHRVRDDAVTRILRSKFAVPDLRDALLATGEAALVHGNPWRDTYWGVSGGRGRNRLGDILMQIRGECRAHRDGIPEDHSDLPLLQLAADQPQ